MKTTSKLVKAIFDLREENKKLLAAQIEYNEAKASLIITDEKYAGLKNGEQREAYIKIKLAKAEEKFRAQEQKVLDAATVKEIAEVEWKSEKYDVIAATGHFND